MTTSHPRRCLTVSLLRLAGIALLAGPVAPAASAADPARPPAPTIDAETAWKSALAYRHGQDLAPLLVIEREAIASMATPAARSALAARLADVVERPETTADARQWACLMLRSVGTPAQVPLLAEQLYRPEPETAEAARQALESIQGPDSLAALRNFLTSRRAPPEGGHAGRLRAGVIDSLGVRRDAAAVPILTALADDTAPLTADAAIRALARIADGPARAFLEARAAKAGVPTPPPLVEPLLRAAAAAAASGDPGAARRIHARLAEAGQTAAARQAGLVGLLDAAPQERAKTTLAWLRDADPDRRAVATAALPRLDDATIATLLDTLGDHGPSVRQSILTVAATRLPAAAVPALLQAARDDDPQVRSMAIECLGRTGAAEAIPALLDALASGGEPARSARDAILSLPRELVVPALVEALDTRPELRPAIVPILGEIGDHAAVEPLKAVAAADDPAPWQAALDSLRQLSQPNAADVGRLVDLFATVDGDERREAVARTIIGVVKRPGTPEAAGELVLSALGRQGLPAVQSLPLVGRIGGTAALERIDGGLTSADPQVRDAAIRGLCNWPDAGVADRMLAIARESLAIPERRDVGRRALHAYVRVITHKSCQAKDRLALLRDAMTLAADGPPEERGFILERTAAAERSLAALDWIAGYLDDPSVAQAACRAVLELAHHRYLRQPNKDRFDPILDRVASIATDPAVADRARRYKLGL